MAERTLEERLVRHEKHCFDMVMSLSRDAKIAQTATKLVLESRERLLRDWATLKRESNG